jgi:hypothetical protein
MMPEACVSSRHSRGPAYAERGSSQSPDEPMVAWRAARTRNS